MTAKNKKIEFKKEDLYDLYITKILTTKEISKIYNCNDTTVNRALRQYLIPRRKNCARLKHNLIGKTFGQLTVLSLHGTYKKRVVWDCICTCGNHHLASTSNFIHQKVRRCNWCYEREHVKYEEISKRYLTSLKKGANRRGLEFDINLEQIWNLFLKQNKKCAISGIELHFKDDNGNKQTASLDRIDSSKGYTLDNIQWIHIHINRMKLDHQQDYFINLCHTISEYNKTKEIINEDGICNTEASES